MFVLRFWVVVIAVSLTHSMRNEMGRECRWNAPCETCLRGGCYFVVPHIEMPICVADWKPYKGQLVTILTPGSEVACSRQPTPVPNPTAFPVPTRPSETTSGPSSEASSSSPPVEPQPPQPESYSWPLVLLIVFTAVGAILLLIAAGWKVRMWMRRPERYSRISLNRMGMFERMGCFRGRGRLDPSDLGHVETPTSARRQSASPPLVATFHNPTYQIPNFSATSPLLPSSSSRPIYSPPSMLTMVTTVPFDDIDLSGSASPAGPASADSVSPQFPNVGSSSDDNTVDMTPLGHTSAAAALNNYAGNGDGDGDGTDFTSPNHNSAAATLRNDAVNNDDDGDGSDLTSPNHTAAAATLNNDAGDEEEDGAGTEELFMDSMEEQPAQATAVDEDTRFLVRSSQHPSQRLAAPPPPTRQSRRLMDKDERRRHSEKK